jgi:hypothetical protein
MKGFKDSTKTQYNCGTGFAKGGRTKGAAKIATVMREFKDGTLHSGSKKGPKVTNPKQAKAIAMSEARKAGAKNMQRGGRAKKMTEAEKQAALEAAVDRGNREQAREMEALEAMRAMEAMRKKGRKSVPSTSMRPLIKRKN